jgi:hypothetical protein
MAKTIRGWMQASRVLVSLAVFLLLIVSAASTSAQTQISFGNSAQNVTLQATSPTSINIGLGACTIPSFTGICTLSGSAFFDDVGAYTFTTTTGTPFTATNTGGTVFPINTPIGATSSFTYTGADADKLTGTVTWLSIANGSANPHFNGILTSVIATGDAAFTSVFSSSTGAFDLILNQLQCNHTPGGGCTLEGLFTDTSAIGSDPVSGGQLVSTTPEPASMLLFGSGLLACCAFIRRRGSVSVAASA